MCDTCRECVRLGCNDHEAVTGPARSVAAYRSASQQGECKHGAAELVLGRGARCLVCGKWALWGG